jgi:hypothetical protein
MPQWRIIQNRENPRDLGTNVTIGLPMCPACAKVLISERLAVGTVADVEKLLEDK